MSSKDPVKLGRATQLVMKTALALNEWDIKLMDSILQSASLYRRFLAVSSLSVASETFSDRFKSFVGPDKKSAWCGWLLNSNRVSKVLGELAEFPFVGDALTTNNFGDLAMARRHSVHIKPLYACKL